MENHLIGLPIKRLGHAIRAILKEQQEGCIDFSYYNLISSLKNIVISPYGFGGGKFDLI